MDVIVLIAAVAAIACAYGLGWLRRGRIETDAQIARRLRSE